MNSLTLKTHTWHLKKILAWIITHGCSYLAGYLVNKDIFKILRWSMNLSKESVQRSQALSLWYKYEFMYSIEQEILAWSQKRTTPLLNPIKTINGLQRNLLQKLTITEHRQAMKHWHFYHKCKQIINDGIKKFVGHLPPR